MVLKKLTQITGAKEVTRVVGTYDRVAKIETTTTNDLKQKIIPIVKNVIYTRLALALKAV